jgi:hypothetical protein
MLSSLGIIFLVVVTAAVLMFSYSAYWGFSIRRALYVRVYRNQALGIGLVAVSFVVASLGLAALEYIIPGHVNPGPAATPYVAIEILPLFYWIDASMLVARRSDPLLRNTLHWKRLRVVFWAGNILSIGIPTSIVALILGPLAWHLVVPLPIAGLPSVPPPPPPAVIPLILAPFLLTGLAGFLCLPIAVRRSKDANLQRSLRWFAVFGVSLLVELVGVAAEISGPLVGVEYAAPTIFMAGNLAGGYFLYKSAKALVPLNKLSGREVS